MYCRSRQGKRRRPGPAAKGRRPFETSLGQRDRGQPCDGAPSMVDIMLDPQIRDWVLLPLTLIMVFLGLG